MRKVERVKQFKKDYARIKRGRYGKEIESLLLPVIETLANDIALETKYRDHLLIGDWKGYRNCHIKPDLILVYKKVEPNILRLIQLASHSELGF